MSDLEFDIELLKNRLYNNNVIDMKISSTQHFY